MELKDFIGLGGVPFVVALTALSKRVPWFTDERTWPFIAVGWGVALNLFVAIALQTDLRPAFLMGLVVGLAGAGLYDVGRAPSKA